MRAVLEQTGVRRLCVAAGFSLALHALIVLSVQRQPGGGVSPLTANSASTPLVARLASAFSDAVLPTTAAPEPAPAVQTAIDAVPPPASRAPPAAAPGDAPADGNVYYFKSSELERRPFPLKRIEVPPPESAAMDSGAVMIRLRISERGRVEDARIIMSTGVPEFEAAALREFSSAQFHPGYRDNLPVRSEMLIEVTLRPPSGAQKAGLPPAAGSN